MSRLEVLPVVVVGAGPVGLTAAVALRQAGLPVTVLEAEPSGRIRPGSRAIYIHRATLRILDEIHPGLGGRLAAEGIVWPVKRTFFRGRPVYVRRYSPPPPGAPPPFTSLPQVRAEEMLYDAALKRGVRFVWEAPVERVDVRADVVHLTLASGGEVAARYVVAADGARSAVRRAVGIPMEGSRSRNSFVVVDVAEDPADPLPLERVFHYQHPAVGHRNVLFVPFAGGWRVDLQLFEDDDPAAWGDVEGVRRWLPRVMSSRYADRITWVSTYQFLQVVASAFCDPARRVLLTGEAAHLFAPFGARGMNSGVVDAVAAARAVAQAVAATDAGAAREAVEAFAAERRSAALYNRDAAGVALRHIQGGGWMLAAKRWLAAAVAPVAPSAGRWLDEGPYGPRSGPPAHATKY